MNQHRTTRRFIERAALFSVMLVVAVFAIWITDRTLRSRAIAEEQSEARGDAAILATGLASELDKFSLLPLALAKDPQVAALTAGASSESRPLNLRLEGLAGQSDAAAIYVMDQHGKTIAASNWNLPTSFIGSNYAFRDYFQQALRSGTATQFALGTVSRKPGLYIASRVGSASAPTGVVAVKVEFDATEANWRRATRGVYVTDAEGVVLLTSDERWRFHMSEGDQRVARNSEADLRRFGLARLPPLRLQPTTRESDVVQVPLVEAQQNIAPVGWDLHLVVDPGQRVAAAVATGRLALVLLGVALVAMVGLVILLRRRRQIHEEAMLAARTRSLREQLSQANRLATLGQISAGVNHEMGQPVAAVRVFAESGEALIAKGETAKAAANFREIIGLTDRIGRITGELRRFTRRQPGERRVVAIGEIIDGALLLLHDRIASTGRYISVPDEELTQATVAAEHIRLEQVLVNLLQNAMDATGPQDPIAIEIERGDTHLRVSVTDEGEGISAERAETLFQPFATSKDDGLGLGLVISRDIMRDLGGDLVFDPTRNATRTATRFTMIIPHGS